MAPTDSIHGHHSGKHAASAAADHNDLGARYCAVIAFIVLAVPANLVIAGPMRSIGSSTRLLGLLSLGLVLIILFRRDLAFRAWAHLSTRTNAVPFALLLYGANLLALYGISYRRIMSPDEVSGGTRVVVGTIAMIGGALAVWTFISTTSALRSVISSIVAAATLSAFVGIIQTFTELNLAEALLLPGLAVNTDVETAVRNDITRVIGSAGHPIEFTVILACVLPLALHVATYSTTRLRRQLATMATIVIALAIPLGVSRSGILGLFTALIAYAVVWNWRQRLTAVVIGFAGLVLYRIIQPGVLGTIYGLFSSASTDTSIEARTSDYPQVAQLLKGREIFGIGPGTFQPNLYLVLDNQYLLSYAEGGVVGVAALVLLVLVSLFVSGAARRRTSDPEIRDTAQAIFAGLLALAVCATTFDLISFLQVSFLLFLFTGLAAATAKIADSSPTLGERLDRRTT